MLPVRAELTRRQLLTALGVGGGRLVAGCDSGIGASGAAPTSGSRRGGTLVISQTSDITHS